MSIRSSPATKCLEFSRVSELERAPPQPFAWGVLLSRYEWEDGKGVGSICPGRRQNRPGGRGYPLALAPGGRSIVDTPP